MVHANLLEKKLDFTPESRYPTREYKRFLEGQLEKMKKDWKKLSKDDKMFIQENEAYKRTVNELSIKIDGLGSYFMAAIDDQLLGIEAPVSEKIHEWAKQTVENPTGIIAEIIKFDHMYQVSGTRTA